MKSFKSYIKEGKWDNQFDQVKLKIQEKGGKKVTLDITVWAGTKKITSKNIDDIVDITYKGDRFSGPVGEYKDMEGKTTHRFDHVDGDFSRLFLAADLSYFMID